MELDWGRITWDWLTRAALPLWADQGIDPKGGFEELLCRASGVKDRMVRDVD